MNVGVLGRRLYGRYVAPKSPHLEKRIREVRKGKYDKEYEKLMKMKEKELTRVYYERDMES